MTPLPCEVGDSVRTIETRTSRCDLHCTSVAVVAAAQLATIAGMPTFEGVVV